MGDRLVLWPGGGRYVASKDVATAAPSCTLIVDWGGLGQDTLEGEFYSSDLVGAWRWSFGGHPNCNDGQFYSQSGWIHPPANLLRDGCASPPENGYTDPEDVFSYQKASSRSLSCPALGGTQTQFKIDLFRNGSFVGRASKNSLLSCSQVSNFYSIAGSFSLDFEFKFYGVKVVSTSGAVSKRSTLDEPLISTVAAIAIDFTDGTGITIPLDYCPEWVQVKPANSCPDGTCYECEHDGEKCCYAIATDGSLELIDRFALTS